MKDRPKANGWWCVIALIGIALCILGGVITNGYPILVGLILLGFSVLVFLFSTFTAPALK